MKNFYKIYNLLLEKKHHYPHYHVVTATNTLFDLLHSKNPDYKKEPDALNDALKLKEKFDPFLNHNKTVNYNQKLKLFVPLSKFIARLIEDGKSRDEIYGENGILDYVFDQLDKKIISNSELFTNEFINDFSSWYLEDFKNYISKIKQIPKNKKISIPKQQSKYKLFLIDNFDEYREKYGHGQTGYKGESEWCTTQYQEIYKKYINEINLNHSYVFVLEKDGWENINPDDSLHGEDPKFHNPYDEYGLSLICLVVDLKTFKLELVTLRWNHLGDFDTAKTGIPNEGADDAFLSFESLSETIGFDVKSEIIKYKKCLDYIKTHSEKVMSKILNVLNKVAKNPPYTLTIDIIRNAESKSKHLNEILFDLKIPDGIKKIENATFSKISYLKSIEIPDSVEELRSSCFEKCINLKSIKLSKNLIKLPDFCFYQCTNLQSIDILDSIEEIGDYCFEECLNLKSFEFSDALENLGKGCFSCCENLESIKLPNHLKNIPFRCFFGCEKLQLIKIPESVEELDTACFNHCSNLKQIIILGDPSIIEHNNRIFYNCSSLKEIICKKESTYNKFKELNLENVKIILDKNIK